jgi:hypothetical protein
MVGRAAGAAAGPSGIGVVATPRGRCAAGVAGRRGPPSLVGLRCGNEIRAQRKVRTRHTTSV